MRPTFPALLLAALTACGLPADPLQDDTAPEALAVDLAAPAGSLSLTTTAARPGRQFVATVRGATPGKRVYLRLSTTGTGSGSCPVNLGGLCLDILDPVVNLGSAMANGQGVARISLTLSAAYDGRSGWLQAVQPNGLASSTSGVVHVLVTRDDDKDGVGVLEGDCDDTDKQIKPGATEIALDAVDQDCDGLELCHRDQDLDGFGQNTFALSSSLSCTAPGVSSNALDCDDTDPTVRPGAPELTGDGIDQDCDGGEDCYRDGDGDGAGSSTIVASTDADCADPGEAASDSDCDDANAAIRPGATEVCDGFDNDCDGGVDAGVWWDAAWPYRIPVTVTTSADWFSEGAPVALDVDFDAALRAMGDTSGLAAGSVRVVHQDCAYALPELPSEFADGVSGLFESVDIVDPAGDGFGAVIWLFDRDGDYTALDVVRPGLQLPFAIYFGSNATTGAMASPSYPTSQTASSDGVTAVLANTETDASFAAASGGVASRLGRVGRPNVASQTGTGAGNGIFMGTTGAGSWVSARADTTATLELVHDGPMLGAVRSTGAVSNAYGGFTYEYLYFQIEGRPEVYAKVTYTLDRASTIGPQSPFFGTAVRPWMTDNNALRTAGLTHEGAGGVPDFDWARGTYEVDGVAPYGVAMGWRRSALLRSRPIFDDATSATPGRYVGLAGQDLSGTFVSGQTTYAGTAGEHVLDHVILAVYPHGGKFGSVSNDFYATLDGPTAQPGAVEAR